MLATSWLLGLGNQDSLLPEQKKTPQFENYGV
jgi:hypothetical protein